MEERKRQHADRTGEGEYTAAVTERGHEGRERRERGQCFYEGEETQHADIERS